MKLFKRIFYPALLLFFWPFAGSSQTAPFWDEIQNFKRQDSLKPPPQNAIVFTGSSSFRMWTSLQQDFPDYTIINRAFGGSTLSDVIRYAEDVIFSYQPKQVVIYCGDNDLASSDTVTARMVYDRFKILYRLIRKKLPTASVVFVSIKPSPSRAKLMPKMVEANKMIRGFLTTERHTRFVDVYRLMLDKHGDPQKDLFLEDQLHMNSKGYAIWTKALKPYLLK